MNQTIENLPTQFANLVADALPMAIYGTLQQYPGRLYVAGGFVRDVMTGQEPHDIDIFADCNWTAVEAASMLEFKGYKVVSDTPNAITVVIPKGDDFINVQFIKRVFGRPGDQIKTFDFTCCQAAVYFEDAGYNERRSFVGICTQAYSEDLPVFRMRYTEPIRDEEPGASVLRMVRLVYRGWQIDEENVNKVVGRFAKELHKVTPKPYVRYRGRRGHCSSYERADYADYLAAMEDAADLKLP